LLSDLSEQVGAFSGISVINDADSQGKWVEQFFTSDRERDPDSFARSHLDFDKVL
jgi:hypothetical protein